MSDDHTTAAARPIRWEPNDLAGRLAGQAGVAEPSEKRVVAAECSGSGISPDGRHMRPAIGDLPEEERDAFDLVRVQGIAQAEAAQMLAVSSLTVKRQLNRGLRLLTEQVADLRPGAKPPGSI
jgi:RNA polymerase sigma-70 factor (ECF subfamily)